MNNMLTKFNKIHGNAMRKCLCNTTLTKKEALSLTLYNKYLYGRTYKKDYSEVLFQMQNI